MIEERSLAVAVCDACHHQDYSDNGGYFVAGYEIILREHETGTRHNAFACKETHIGKAARAALNRWRVEDILPPPKEGDMSTLPPDAPLPESNGDVTAVAS